RVSVDMSARALRPVQPPAIGRRRAFTANQATVPRGTRRYHRHAPSSIYPNLNQFGGNDRRGSCRTARGLGSVASAPLCEAIGKSDRIVKNLAIAPYCRSGLPNDGLSKITPKPKSARPSTPLLLLPNHVNTLAPWAFSGRQSCARRRMRELVRPEFTKVRQYQGRSITQVRHSASSFLVAKYVERLLGAR
ncbi:MAG: hypothetical protein QOK09_3205, partial [Mycobacterium sp.]|nr:hypothetical protein [Mycobacterium sp.]